MMFSYVILFIKISPPKNECKNTISAKTNIIIYPLSRINNYELTFINMLRHWNCIYLLVEYQNHMDTAKTASNRNVADNDLMRPEIGTGWAPVQVDVPCTNVAQNVLIELGWNVNLQCVRFKRVPRV